LSAAKHSAFQASGDSPKHSMSLLLLAQEKQFGLKNSWWSVCKTAQLLFLDRQIEEREGLEEDFILHLMLPLWETTHAHARETG
jgi:hypothetical protein